MNLHRAGKSPDWELEQPADWNRWQRLAARTNGLVTPGNMVTAGGNALVVGGLGLIADGRTGSGLLVMLAGRAADLVDGMVAHKTKTKSPVGEAFDASSDKLQAAGAVAVFAVKNVIPSPILWPLALQQGLISLSGVVAKKRGRELHPSRAGKLSTFAMWGAMGSFPLAEQMSGGGAVALETTGYTALAVTIVLGGKAIAEYAQTAFDTTAHEAPVAENTSNTL